MSNDGKTAGAEPAARKKGKKLKITVGVVAVVVVAAVGFWVWHNDPSFCNNQVCHDSMDPYVESYYQEDGAAGTDKWGNGVANTHAMLVVSHKGESVACLDCHVPDLAQQIGEVQETLSGAYALPLEEVDGLSLLVNSNHASPSGLGDEFCMNGSCHADLTREALTLRTADRTFNPHSWQHRDNA